MPLISYASGLGSGAFLSLGSGDFPSLADSPQASRIENSPNWFVSDDITGDCLETSNSRTTERHLHDEALTTRPGHSNKTAAWLRLHPNAEIALPLPQLP